MFLQFLSARIQIRRIVMLLLCNKSGLYAVVVPLDRIGRTHFPYVCNVEAVGSMLQLI